MQASGRLGQPFIISRQATQTCGQALLRSTNHRRGWELVATRHGPYPHCDGSVEMRKVFHKLRSQAIEPFNGLFKNVFEWRVKRPIKGLQRSQLLALGAVVIYQLVLLYQHERQLPVGKGIKL